MLVSPILLVVLIGCTHHATGELKPVDIPALGRPFSLGDLYDRRRDVIVQGPKLWSHTELDNFSESKTYSTRFEIVTSESIDEDMKHLDLSASIKMSFLAGLIKVSGSASYLDDRKKKNNQARVSLKYKSTTFKRVLKPRVFTKVTYPDVLKKATDATDVVVAIQYGAGAIFTFDRSVKMSEHKRDIQGNLEVAVKKIPTFEVNGQGKVEIGEAEKKNTESFTCKFHGDFVLRNHPGTYQEAIKVYKELPELLGMNYENSVPVKVWLYPLEKLPLERTAQIVYDVKESLVVSVTDQIEDLQNIIRQCNDILDTQVATHHGRIRMKVDDFKSYVERYVLLYKQKLISILPAIRKGESSMSELTRLVTDKERSPFAQRNLQLWISRFNEEVAVLSRIQSLPNYCRDSGDFSAKLLNGKKYTLGLTLKIGSYEDKYLDAIREFLITEQNTRLPNQHMAKWWRPGSMTLYNLQVMSSTFKQFHDIKEKESQTSLSSPNVQFLVREEIIYDGEKEDIQIELYNGAYLSQKSYQLTSAPGRPDSTAKTHASITIRWVKPEKGYNNLRSFVIRCYTVRTNGMSEGCEGNYCKVDERVVAKSRLSYTMSGLRTQTPYFFTVTSKTDLGETATSISSDQISTTKCSPGNYEMGERQCKQCAKGTYSKYYGQESCNPCPSGTFGSVEGLKAVSECQQCPKGTYNTKTGQQAASICIRCPAGTFNDKTGSNAVSACKKCPKGSHNGHTGQQSAAACSKCKVNFYNDREGTAQCKACPSGMKTKAIGAVYVSECHSAQGSAQMGAQLKTMKDQVSNEIEKFEDEAEESEKQIADAMKKLNAEKTGITKIVTQHVQHLQKEFANIFDCTWGLGDGMYGSNAKHDSYVGVVKNREHCVYKCLQMRAYKDQTINGATHGVKDNKCWCEKNMNARDSKSNYYSCIFKFN